MSDFHLKPAQSVNVLATGTINVQFVRIFGVCGKPAESADEVLDLLCFLLALEAAVERLQHALALHSDHPAPGGLAIAFLCVCHGSPRCSADERTGASRDIDHTSFPDCPVGRVPARLL